MSRLLTTGFEFSGTTDNGLLSLSSEMSITSLFPRRSAGNNGGIRSLDANTTSANIAIFQPFPYLLSDSYMRIYTRINSAASTHEYIFYDQGGASEIFKLRFQNSMGPFVLSVNGIDVATGVATFELDTYYSIKIRGLIDAAGIITVDIDGVNDITYNGATNGGGTGWDQLKLNTDGRVLYDDIAINDTFTRINYDGGNGDIPSGTITGSGPGTATVMSHTGDGITGFIIVDTTAGSFSDNDTLSDTGTFTGVVNGDEDTSSTGALNEGFVQLFYPNGVGTTSNLTNSDDNKINNYSFVNTFEGTTDFVYDEAGGVGDTYAISDLPSEALSVGHVDAYFYCKRDGNVVNNVKSVIRAAGTDYESYDENIPGSLRWVGFSYQENPDTKAPWTISDLNSVEAGPKLET